MSTPSKPMNVLILHADGDYAERLAAEFKDLNSGADVRVATTPQAVRVILDDTADNWADVYICSPNVDQWRMIFHVLRDSCGPAKTLKTVLLSTEQWHAQMLAPDDNIQFLPCGNDPFLDATAALGLVLAD